MTIVVVKFVNEIVNACLAISLCVFLFMSCSLTFSAIEMPFACYDDKTTFSFLDCIFLKIKCS